ncbi:MAG: GYDIA family GHMP kinase [Flavobacteriaceae bacterium]
MKTFYSNGKLLLTGEYVVLDGALALAIPTKKGQLLKVEESTEKGIHWKSLDENGSPWFEASFNVHDAVSERENRILFILLKILREAQNLNTSFLAEEAIRVTTQLTFPRNWGLGTSSTLINNIAQWAKVDAFQLLKNSFGGSGYDIAAAQHSTPILFQLYNGKPTAKEIQLHWDFKAHLFFVHLNQKQDSLEGIAHYKSKNITSEIIKEISSITQALYQCTSIDEFEKLLELHELILSRALHKPTVKEKLFKDYPRAIKSLGAWGGDFILATGTKEAQAYFREKGYTTLLPFEEMILK